MIREAKYRCTGSKADPKKYGLISIDLKRSDGNPGWLRVTGPDLEDVAQGQEVIVTICPIETVVPSPPHS